jgi:hypothetical protein
MNLNKIIKDINSTFNIYEINSRKKNNLLEKEEIKKI